MNAPTIFRSRVTGNLVINRTAHPMWFTALRLAWQAVGGWTIQTRVGMNMADFAEFVR